MSKGHVLRFTCELISVKEERETGSKLVRTEGSLMDHRRRIYRVNVADNEP